MADFTSNSNYDPPNSNWKIINYPLLPLTWTAFLPVQGNAFYLLTLELLPYVTLCQVKTYLHSTLTTEWTNCIRFWQRLKDKYLKLYQLHIRHHIIPATSAGIETACSLAGIICSGWSNQCCWQRPIRTCCNVLTCDVVYWVELLLVRRYMNRNRWSCHSLFDC